MAHRLAPKPPALAPLRVLPRGTALVQDYRALHETGTNRFHGWRWDGALGPEFVDVDPLTKQQVRKNHGGRVKAVDAVIEIAADDPYRSEYIRHLRDGDLWAADEATARAAGVEFEPHFLGEHPEMATKNGVALEVALSSLGVSEESHGGLPWDTMFKPKVSAAEPTGKQSPAAKTTTKQGS